MRLPIILIGLLAALVGCSGASSSLAPSETGKTIAALKDAPRLKIVSLTSPVRAGDTAMLVAQTVPNAACEIDVRYASYPGDSALFAKPADATGRVYWMWVIPERATAGTWPVIVKASNGGKIAGDRATLTVK